MKYIDNYELREWIKENLKKSIFQKAHALAVQTGCEILVKLEEDAVAKDISSTCQFYATTKLQRSYRWGSICQKPGETRVSGVTGLPMTTTVDTAVQSCENVAFHRLDPTGSSNNENNNVDATYHSRNNPSTNSSNHTISIYPPKQISHTAASEGEQTKLFKDFPMQHHQGAENVFCEANIAICEATDSETSNTAPADVKLEVEDIVKFDENDRQEELNIDYADTLNNEDDVTMEPLPPEPEEEDIYNDYYGNEYFGSVSSGDASHQMAPDDSMNQLESLGLDSHANIRQQNPSPLGAPPSSEISTLQTSAPQNSSLSTHHATDSGSAGPTPSALWARSRYSLPSSRMYRTRPKFINRRSYSIRRPMHVQQQASSSAGNKDAPVEPAYKHLRYPVTLPNFSHSVQVALENGSIHDLKMWSQFCKEAAQFYMPLLDILETHDKHSSNVYQSIGRSMYERYPCIIGVGVRPWTYFNKWLSTKIRQARFREKKKDQEF